VRRPKRWPLDQLAPYILDLASRERERPETSAPLEFASIFGNSHPVELEVGCGKGGYLVAAAADRPQNNFLGLEIDRALYFYVASRLAKRGLTNARVACADAKSVVRDRIADRSFAAVHVYFPDPWWKKRHHKRRLWTSEFAAQCGRILAPGGRLHIATDVGEYYQLIRELLDAQPQLERVLDEEQAGQPDDGESLTNFERKARARGGEVWRAEYVRRQ
jgi:tRNA (guanine-N7-)-methyltransferase